MGFGRAHRCGGLALLGLLGCRAPDTHPGQRCDAVQPCAEELVCYRGFCVADDGAGEQSDLEPAAADERDGAASAADGGASSQGPSREGRDAEVAVAGDQIATATEPSRAREESAETSGPVADAQATRDDDRGDEDVGEQVDAGAAGAAPEAGAASADAALVPIEAITCFAECAGPSAAEKECRKCVKKAFGVELEKLCGGGDDDDDDDQSAAPKNPLCAVLCLSSELFGVECALSCSEQDCGGD